MNQLRKLLASRSGVTAVEYGVWSGIFVIIILASFGALSDALELTFGTLETAIVDSTPTED